MQKAFMFFLKNDDYLKKIDIAVNQQKTEVLWIVWTDLVTQLI